MASDEEKVSLQKKLQAEKNNPLATLHKAIVQEIALDRRLEILKDGKIDFELNFRLERPNASMGVHAHTRQFGEKVLTSLDKRDGRALVPVNGNIETVSFKAEGQRPVISNKLRTGSFDYYDVNPVAAPTQISAHEIKAQLDEIQRMHPGDRLRYIETTMQSKNPVQMKALIEALYLAMLENPADTPVDRATLLQYEKRLQNLELFEQYPLLDDKYTYFKARLMSQPSNAEFATIARIERDPTTHKALIVALKEKIQSDRELLGHGSTIEDLQLLRTIQGDEKMVSKLEAEFAQLARDQTIIARNAASITNVLTNQASKLLGMDLHRRLFVFLLIQMMECIFIYGM